MHTLTIDQPFVLENGFQLPSLTIAYDTFGRLNDDRSNAIWVCHALTANSDVADWWPHTVEKGRFLDPEKYFVVCANILGSHYGTTGPLSINPVTGEPWYDTFPQMTVRDMVAAHMLLARHLGIESVEMLIGSSLGGFQCMEWAVMQPQFPRRLVLIATTPVSKPWAAAFNESQRMCIEADETYGLPCADAGMKGLSAARSIALLSYRGQRAYDLTQADTPEKRPQGYPLQRRVHSYQTHQGEKLCSRFNAYSYYRLSRAVDAHDIGWGRGGVENALSRVIAPTLVIAIDGDILFPPVDHRELVECIPCCKYHEIQSDYGHDGFLIEYEKLDRLIKDFMSHYPA
ncbi:MAG: homoserine O-acetyltransferase [Clostridiales bacterium]|nr:homoserine O-acetyltransferase [Clostridiales bacterium]